MTNRTAGAIPRLLTVQDVADALGVPVSRVYDRWRIWGLPALRIGSSLRVREDRFLEWLDQQVAA